MKLVGRRWRSMAAQPGAAQHIQRLRSRRDGDGRDQSWSRNEQLTCHAAVGPKAKPGHLRAARRIEHDQRPEMCMRSMMVPFQSWPTYLASVAKRRGARRLATPDVSVPRPV